MYQYVQIYTQCTQTFILPFPPHPYPEENSNNLESTEYNVYLSLVDIQKDHLELVRRGEVQGEIKLSRLGLHLECNHLPEFEAGKDMLR